MPSEPLWECSVCCVPRPWSEPPRPCPVCGALQLSPVVVKAAGPSSAAAFLCDANLLVAAYLDDIAEIVAAFQADVAAAEPRGTEQLASCVQHGVIADSGLGWVPDGPTVNLDAMLANHPGKRMRATYEVVGEARDTERPPPMEPSDSPVDLLRIGRECVGWSKDTGGCHLCEPVVPGAHEPGCPVGDYMLATTSHGRVAPPPMFSPTEPDTFAPVTNVTSDSDELTATRGGRMVPRYDARDDGEEVAS